MISGKKKKEKTMIHTNERESAEEKVYLGMAISIKKRLKRYTCKHSWGNCYFVSYEKISRHMTDSTTIIIDLFRSFISPPGLYKTVFSIPTPKIYNQMLSLMVLQGSLLRFIEMCPTIGFPSIPITWY